MGRKSKFRQRLYSIPHHAKMGIRIRHENLQEFLVDRFIETKFKEICSNEIFAKEPSLDFSGVCGVLAAWQKIFITFSGKIRDKHATTVNEFQHVFIMLANLIVGEQPSAKDQSLIEHLTKTLQPFRVGQIQTAEAVANQGVAGKKTLDQILAELDALIGLDSVKSAAAPVFWTAG
jgi:hypothetical protein